MISYQSDGTTLAFTRDGQTFSANPIDWTAYTVFSATQSAQQDAARVNTNSQANYLGALGNYNASILAGRNPSGPPPVKPQKIVVDDPTVSSSGVWSEGVHHNVDFSPALPDSLPLPTQAVNQGIKATTGLPPDPNAAILGALASMSRVLNLIATKLEISS
jgi:hypothetical protein